MRWLSKGDSFVRVYELKEAVDTLLVEKTQKKKSGRAKDFQNVTEEDEFWPTIAYLADIFEIFNYFNKNLQGKQVNIFKVSVLLF